MKRIFFLFLFAFLVLLTVSLFLAKAMRPTAGNANPLKDVQEENITRISLEGAQGHFSLQRGAEGWMFVEPINDIAEDSMVQTLTSTLRRGVMGSIVSENKANFPKYKVDTSSGVHVRVYLSSDTTAALDGYVGKSGPNYTDSFFRFEGQDAVYLASDMPSYLFQEKILAYQLKEFFRQPLDQATGFSIRGGKIDVSIERSSDSWKNLRADGLVSEKWVGDLRVKIQALKPTQFESGLLSEKFDFGGASVYTLTVMWGQDKRSVLIGHPANLPPPDWYARIDGRPLLFTVGLDEMKNLLDFLKTPPSKV